MMGPSHAATGAAAWIVLGPLAHVNPGAVAATIPLAAFAALGPDIDHPKATISRILPFIGWPIQKVTKHRVQTHSLSVAAVLIGAVYPFLGLAVTAALATGWVVGHLAADCLTVEGCALLWPLSSKKSDFGFMTTGKAGELIYSILLWPAVLLYYVMAIKNGWLA